MRKYLLLLVLSLNLSIFSSDYLMASDAIEIDQQHEEQPKKLAHMLVNISHTTPPNDNLSIKKTPSLSTSQLAAQFYQNTNINDDMDTPSVNFLPDELCLLVYSYLTIADVVRLSSVSKQWYNLLNDHMIWKDHANRFMLISSIELDQSAAYYKDKVKAFVQLQLNFNDLGMLNNGKACGVCAVSSDGQTSVGYAEDGAEDNADRAFKWTLEHGMQSLGILDGGSWSNAHGTNFNGQIIVGSADNSCVGDTIRAFKWTAEHGMQSLGVLNNGKNSSSRSMSKDKGIIVGTAEDGADQNMNRAFYWTQQEGMQSLGVLNGGEMSAATNITSNGKIIVGGAADGAADNAKRAFYWTKDEGMQSLGVLNGGKASSAYNISRDGQTIVGTAEDGANHNARRAFYWTKDQGMQSAGVLNGGHESAAFGISGDSQIIIGAAQNGFKNERSEAFYWTKACGMRSVASILGTVMPNNWQLTQANDISRDGTVIVGDGEHKGSLRKWRVTIPRYGQ